MHQDMLYALRAMRKNAAFTVTAVLTLALGIGANTAIFTVIRAVLLNPLPYRDPDRLVYLAAADPQRNQPEVQFTRLRFDEMSAAAHSFTAVGAFGANIENVTLSGDFEPEPLKGARVSTNFLDVLGTVPLVGRGFLPNENDVVMISAALWKRRFGADPRIAGKTAMLDAKAYTIAGVLPPGFEFPFAGADVWFTRPWEWSALPSRYWGAALLKGFARLRPGTTLAQARAEMEVLSRQYNAAHPGIDRGIMQVVYLKERVVRNVRPLLRILLGAVAFVLLIACANVASLLMARASSRGREFALRAALGARRVRLVRQLLAESLVLAFAGGVAGTLVAQWCLRALQSVDDSKMAGILYLPGRADIRLDATVLAFTLALSLVTGVLFGLFPIAPAFAAGPCRHVARKRRRRGPRAFGQARTAGYQPARTARGGAGCPLGSAADRCGVVDAQHRPAACRESRVSTGRPGNYEDRASRLPDTIRHRSGQHFSTRFCSAWPLCRACAVPPRRCRCPPLHGSGPISARWKEPPRRTNAMPRRTRWCRASRPAISKLCRSRCGGDASLRRATM